MSKIRKPLDEFKPDIRLADDRGPTKERIAQTLGNFVIGDTGTVTVRQGTVERAVRRGTLNEQQGRAAEKLYIHWFNGGLAGTVGSPSDWEGLRGGTGNFCGLAKTERQIFHRDRFAAAYRMVSENLDASAAQVLMCIVCQELPFEEAGRRVGYVGAKQAQVAAIEKTRYALNILAREWGIY